MPDRIATTHWKGSLFKGSGTIDLVSSQAGHFTFSLSTRTGEPDGQTSPEELIAAAHSACYSMQLSALLTAANTPPERIDTTAAVSQKQRGEAYVITDSQLTVRAVVPGIDATTFRRAAENAKNGCPVSVALQGVTITLDAELEN